MVVLAHSNIPSNHSASSVVGHHDFLIVYTIPFPGIIVYTHEISGFCPFHFIIGIHPAQIFW